MTTSTFLLYRGLVHHNHRFFFHLIIINYSETLDNEYIERIHQMSYSSLSDSGMLQIFSF